jgi:hypothetical protein
VKVPNREHTSRPWRIHEIAYDFRLEDVWTTPQTAGRDDFRRLVDRFVSYDPLQSSSFVVRNLFAIRWKLGELFGWDRPESGIEARVPSLRDRLPADLRDGHTGPDPEVVPFRSLYLLDDEWAAELANETVHGILHIGWVPDGSGAYRAQLAVYVKPHGLLGNLYLAAIRPFRYVLVYPSLLRELGERMEPAAADTADVALTP